MRLLGVLILLVTGLGLGVVPVPASAELCSFHSHEAATAGAQSAGTTLAATAASEATAFAAVDDARSLAPHPVSDHHASPGHFCCQVAAAVTPALGPTVGPYRRTAGRISPYPWLSPRVAPMAGIYRPPEFA